MTTTTEFPAARSWARTDTGAGRRTWLGRAEDWLDARGRGAWIAAMVAGFIVFWPIGLALLAYMIWGKRMFGNSNCTKRSTHMMRRGGMSGSGFAGSGNTAFDAYRDETIRRLEEEQDAFAAFLRRLREAKDKSEFDAFMEDRARAARTDRGTPSQDAPPAPFSGSGAY